MSQPLMSFKSHVAGKNADVLIYPDRIEWTQGKGMSAGKLAAGAMTAGLSLAATGLRKSKAGSEMVPMKSVSSVTTEKDGLRYMLVRVITTGNTIDFRVTKSEADSIKGLLTQLVLGNHPSQQTAEAPAAPAAPTAPPAPSPAAAPADGGDLHEQLRRLAGLRDDGILTDEEFAAEKAKLLG